MIDFRENGVVGVLDLEDSLVPVTLHFSEWWNGEGLDLTFLNGEGKNISLHMDEIEALVIAAKLTGLLSFSSLKKKVKKAQKESQVRSQELQNLRDSFVYAKPREVEDAGDF